MNGLRREPRTDPERQLLESLRLLSKTAGLTGDWKRLIDEGGFWTPLALPAAFDVMPVKHCFENAATLVLSQNRISDRRLRYVEGYGLAYLPCHHAWTVDDDGNVIDPTWRTRAGKHKTDPATLAYWGIVISESEIDAITARTGRWGMLWRYWDREPGRRRTA